MKGYVILDGSSKLKETNGIIHKIRPTIGFV